MLQLGLSSVDSIFYNINQMIILYRANENILYNYSRLFLESSTIDFSRCLTSASDLNEIYVAFEGNHFIIVSGGTLTFSIFNSIQNTNHAHVTVTCYNIRTCRDNGVMFSRGLCRFKFDVAFANRSIRCRVRSRRWN